MLRLPKLQLKMIEKDTQIKMYSGAITGRIQGEYPNIIELPRTSRDYQEGEWRWQQCQEAERENGHKLCDVCHERFKCWTASRPQPHFFGDTHIGLQRIQQCMRAYITVDEASKTFEKCVRQLYKEYNV